MDAPNDSTFRILDWIISGVGGLLAALWGMTNTRMKKIEDANANFLIEQTRLEVKIASEYTPKRDLERLSEALFKKLDTIESLLHQKADK